MIGKKFGIGRGWSANVRKCWGPGEIISDQNQYLKSQFVNWRGQLFGVHVEPNDFKVAICTRLLFFFLVYIKPNQIMCCEFSYIKNYILFSFLPTWNNHSGTIDFVQLSNPKAMSSEEQITQKKEVVAVVAAMEDHKQEEEELPATRVPPWTKQITVRGVVASAVIGCIYSVIAMKLNLTTGITPNFNVSAALLAFIFVRTWTKLLRKLGISSAPFTRQENTMIQTCAVACYSIAIGG